jgi:hypothetical protein
MKTYRSRGMPYQRTTMNLSPRDWDTIQRFQADHAEKHKGSAPSASAVIASALEALRWEMVR